MAAGGVEAAHLAGQKGNALVATEPRADLIEAFVSAGGSRPRYAEMALCYAERQDDARQTAHRYFRWAATGWPVMAELPDPAGFAAASRHVSPNAVAEVVSCGTSRRRTLRAPRSAPITRPKTPTPFGAGAHAFRELAHVQLLRCVSGIPRRVS
jgi:hypothetical protein